MEQQSNFLNVYKIAHKERALFLKNSFLGALITICFVLGSFCFGELLNDLNVVNAIGFGIFWLIGLGLLPVLFLALPWRDFLIWNFIISFSAFIPLMLGHHFGRAVWLLAAAVFLSLLWAMARMRNEYNATINLQWNRIVEKGSLAVFLGWILILAAFLYFHGVNFSWEQTLDSAMTGWTTMQPSSWQISGTVDDILNNYLDQQISGLGALGSTGGASILEGAKSQLSDLFGYSVSGEESLPTLVVKIFQSRWESFPFAGKIGVAFFAFLFVLNILKFFNVIFSVILMAVSWLLFQILLSGKYLSIQRIGVEKQKIIIAV